MASKKKADCTPEEWSLCLAEARESMRRSLAKPEVKARHQARSKARYEIKKEEIKQKKKEKYQNDPAVKEKARKYARERYNNDPEFREQQKLRINKIRSKPEHKNTVRARELAKAREKRTGASASLVQTLVTLQENKCAVCLTTFTKTPHVDHCHREHRTRGLLCSRCNTVEGMISTSGLSPAEFAQRLQAYLDNPPAEIARLA